MLNLDVSENQPKIKSARERKPVNYLVNANNQLNSKETYRSYVLNSRQILWKQISINDKVEETEWLKEFIVMEEEQLQEK